MDEFLKGTEAFSFEALVDAAFNDGEAASSRPAKLEQKSTKKGEKNQGESRGTKQGSERRRLCRRGTDSCASWSIPLWSRLRSWRKRGGQDVQALHRALYGFNRRSGGKKHKPKAKAKSIGKRPVAGAVGGKKYAALRRRPQLLVAVLAVYCSVRQMLPEI